MSVAWTLQRNWIEVPLYAARRLARWRDQRMERPAYRIVVPIRVYKTYREHALGLVDCLRALGHRALLHPVRRFKEIDPLQPGDRVVAFGTYRFGRFERAPGVLYAGVNAEFYGETPEAGMIGRTRDFIDRCDLLFESNEVSLRQAHQLGMNPAGLLPFAWSPRWDWQATPTSPRYDVAFLGRIRHSEYRSKLWEDLRRRFTVCPRTVAWGRGRVRFLRSARIQLSLRQGSADHFPGHRFAMTLANRCFVLSEPLPDEAPFRAGVHYGAASTDEMGDAIEHYLAHPEQMQQIAEQGHRFFRDEYRLFDHAARVSATMDAAWETVQSGATLDPIRADLLPSGATL